VGPIVYSSAIPGTDPRTGDLSAATREEVAQAFRNLDEFLAAAEVENEDVVRLTVLLSDETLRDAVNEEWLARFPDPLSRPARHTTVGGLRVGMRIQLEVVAVASTL
jgi:2-iminobutanoate/2-iminopropanoate deaminase